MKRLTVLVVLIFVIGLAAAPIFTGRYYGTGDTADVFIPLETFFQSEQLAGRIPSWNPNISWGFPVLASAQLGFFYPLLLIGRLFPIWLYLPALFYLHIFGAAVGTYLLLRAQRVSTPAAVLGACAFSLSQFVWQHATHFNIIIVLSWLPWQLLIVQSVARQARVTARHIAWLALGFGLPFLAGHIQIPLMTASIAALYLFHQRWVNRLPWRRLFLGFLLAVVLAVGLASAQLLPTAELTRLSDRGGSEFDLTQANQHSWPLYHLPTAIWPRFFDMDANYWGKRLEIEYGFFVGTIPLLFGFATWSNRRQLRFWWGLLLVSFLLALGNLSPFRWLGFEPSLWLFSAPARWLLFTTMAGAVLAAHGFDRLQDNPVLLRRYLRVGFVTVLVITVLYNVGLWLSPENSGALTYEAVQQHAPELLSGRPASYYIGKIEQLLTSLQTSGISWRSPFTFLPLITLGLATLLYRQRQIITAIAVVELIVVASLTSPTVPLQSLLAPPTAIKQVPDSVRAGQARIATFRREGGDTGLLLTNPASRRPAADASNRKLLGPLTYAQFNLPGVEWPASLPMTAHSQQLETLHDSLTSPAFDTLVTELNIAAVIVEDQNKRTFYGSATEMAAGTMYVNGTYSRAELITDTVIAPVAYEQVSPTHVRLDVTAETAGQLLVRDTWYPGWQATIDGQSAPISQVDPFFRSIDIPPGKHLVQMQYRPQALAIGMLVSALAALVCLLLVVIKKPLAKANGM